MTPAERCQVRRLGPARLTASCNGTPRGAWREEKADELLHAVKQTLALRGEEGGPPARAEDSAVVGAPGVAAERRGKELDDGPRCS